MGLGFGSLCIGLVLVYLVGNSFKGPVWLMILQGLILQFW